MTDDDGGGVSDREAVGFWVILIVFVLVIGLSLSLLLDWYWWRGVVKDADSVTCDNHGNCVATTVYRNSSQDCSINGEVVNCSDRRFLLPPYG